MTQDLDARDRQRERWRRARESLRLVDPEAEDFATGGLAARFVTDPGVRLLILPADPEAWLLEFDEGFWQWWLQEWPDPVTGRPTGWGRDGRPTSRAALRLRSQASNDRWKSYLALYRHGGLELELGREGMVPAPGGGYVRLINIVGRAWGAMDLYRDVIRRFDIAGPWEVSLALCKADRAHLEHFGEGWPEPEKFWNEVPGCREPGLLFRQELSAWPDADGVRVLAFKIGGWLEDAWEQTARRFLVRDGPLAGQFDKARYGW
ncbi:MAG: hypothetical protein HY690_18275 [Chloroflexi bacterium]|nr:hypothetical protein [Chloroflexota bacterium]